MQRRSLELGDMRANLQAVFSRRLRIFSPSLLRQRLPCRKKRPRTAPACVSQPAESSARKPAARILAACPEIPAGPRERPAVSGPPSPATSAAASRIASSDFSSASSESPYPDLASTVVVPEEDISRSAVTTFSASCDFPALRTPIHARANAAAGLRDLLVSRSRDPLLKIHQPRRSEGRMGVRIHKSRQHHLARAIELDNAACGSSGSTDRATRLSSCRRKQFSRRRRGPRHLR